MWVLDFPTMDRIILRMRVKALCSYRFVSPIRAIANRKLNGAMF